VLLEVEPAADFDYTGAQFFVSARFPRYSRFSMALKATVFKAQLSLSDMDRNLYQDFSLTLARHPSETDERMMIRLAAFAWHAAERLEFTKGLSADDEPELWRKNYSDEIELWIELGQPDERRLKKACNRSRHVVLYLYGGRGTSVWWKQNQGKLGLHDNLTVIELSDSQTLPLTEMVERTMQLTCTISDGQLWVSNGRQEVTLDPVLLMGIPAREL
jgi:uncharacterized protein YaeQ